MTTKRITCTVRDITDGYNDYYTAFTANNGTPDGAMPFKRFRQFMQQGVSVSCGNLLFEPGREVLINNL